MTATWSQLGSRADLLLEAGSLEQLITEATGAFSTFLGTVESEPLEERVPTLADGRDPAALLANYLDDLVFLAEEEHFVAQKIEELVFEEWRIRASLSGLSSAPHAELRPIYPTDVTVVEKSDLWTARVRTERSSA